VSPRPPDFVEEIFRAQIQKLAGPKDKGVVIDKALGKMSTPRLSNPWGERLKVGCFPAAGLRGSSEHLLVPGDPKSLENARC